MSLSVSLAPHPRPTAVPILWASLVLFFSIPTSQNYVNFFSAHAQDTSFDHKLTILLIGSFSSRSCQQSSFCHLCPIVIPIHVWIHTDTPHHVWIEECPPRPSEVCPRRWQQQRCCEGLCEEASWQDPVTYGELLNFFHTMPEGWLAADELCGAISEIRRSSSPYQENRRVN